MEKEKLKKAIEDHNGTMAKIADAAAEGHITMLEAAQKQGDEIRRFRLALKAENDLEAARG